MRVTDDSQPRRETRTGAEGAGPDRVAAERDALEGPRDARRADLEAAGRHRGRADRARRVAAPFLVFVFALSFLASGLGVWLHRNTLNGDVWAERVVPLGRDPQVQAALADWTTAQVMTTVDTRSLLADSLPPRAQVLAGPLSSAVNGWVGDRVDRFFASSRFERLWTVAATRAHDGAVDLLRHGRPNIGASGDRIELNLIPVIDAVLADVAERAPSLVGSDARLPKVTIDDAPEAARERIGRALGVDLGDDFGTIAVYDGGKLAAAQRAVRAFDRLVVLTVALTVLSAVAALVVSPRRRRTLLQLLGAAAMVGVLIRRATFLLEDQVTGLVRVDSNRPAVSVVLHTFTDPLTGAAATALWIVAVASLVVVVSGPYGWAVRLRRVAAGATRSMKGTVGGQVRDPTTTEWIRTHADALRLGGYATGALLLWFVELTWVKLLVVVALVAAWQIALYRVTRHEPRPDAGPVPPRGAGT